ncbi:MAG: hypothetical protein JNM27_07385 [Leptospirales bacterium]|nr:hypothetical protein [Leptospirales bacterium]
MQRRNKRGGLDQFQSVMIRSLRLLSAVFIVICVVGCSDRLEFDQGLNPVHVGALPAGIATHSASECAVCHRGEFHDWKESVHGRAFTNELFQDSFRIEPAVWCVNCHAPLREQAMQTLPGQIGIVDRNAVQTVSQTALRNEGINCVACHVRDGIVYGTNKGAIERGSKHHPMKYSTYLSSSSFCGGCHEFNFPYFPKDKVVEYGPSPMQSTHSEWRMSSLSLAGIGCKDCHSSPLNHKVYGPHTPGWLEKKVTLEAILENDRVAVARVTIRGIPHSFPTGDLFRGLDVDVLASGERIGRKTFGRKTGDFKDAHAPGGVYKHYYAENVLRPDWRGSIDETIRIPLDRPVSVHEVVLVQLIYFYRNRDAERTLPQSLTQKEIARAEVYPAYLQQGPSSLNQPGIGFK